MTFFTASIETIVLRYFLMMAVVITTFWAGLPFLALLAVPICLSALTGITIFRPKKKIAQRVLRRDVPNTKIAA